MNIKSTDVLDSDGCEVENLKPDDVATFLMNNPGFFSEHPDVLDCIDLPDRFVAGGVVDFQRYQLQRRDSEINELRTCAQDVIETKMRIIQRTSFAADKPRRRTKSNHPTPCCWIAEAPTRVTAVRKW